MEDPDRISHFSSAPDLANVKKRIRVDPMECPFPAKVNEKATFASKLKSMNGPSKNKFVINLKLDFSDDYCQRLFEEQGLALEVVENLYDNMCRPWGGRFNR